MSEKFYNGLGLILLVLLALALKGYDIKNDIELTKYKEQLRVEFADTRY
jgi:hypothetical protein